MCLKKRELFDICGQRAQFCAGENNRLRMIVDESIHGNVDQVCHYARRILYFLKKEEDMFK
jgi:hypothetical protein